MSHVSTQAGFFFFWNVDFDWKLRRDMTLFLRCPRIFTLALTLFLVGAASFAKTTTTAKKRNTSKAVATGTRSRTVVSKKTAVKTSTSNRRLRAKLRRARYVSG